MKRKAWLLSAVAVAALSQRALLAQDTKAPVASPAPVMTSAPVINVVDPGYYSDGGGSGGGGRVLADVGFMVLTPKWKDNPAWFAETFSTTSESAVAYQQQDFSYHSQFVPQLSLGFTSADGLGVRVGWWGFAQSTRQNVTASDGNTEIVFADPLQILTVLDQNAARSPEQILTAAELHMDVWDFEVVQSFGSGRWSALASGGLRYAHISQQYDALRVQLFNGDQGPVGPRQFIISGHDFDGEGPTFGLEGRRGIGDTGLYVYGKARASYLFGTSKQAVAAGNIVNDPLVVTNASSRSNSMVPEGELEMGIGFERDTRLGVVFFQIGGVAQQWGEIGNASESSGAHELATDSISRDGTLGLIGFTMKAGITY